MAGYDVYIGRTRVAQVTAAQYVFHGLDCGTSYQLGVDSFTSAGVRSAVKSVNASTGPCADTSPPDMPTALAPAETTSDGDHARLGDGAGQRGRRRLRAVRNGEHVGTTVGTRFTFTPLTCGRSYTLGVESFDAAGNSFLIRDGHSEHGNVPGTTAPTPPTNLQLIGVTASSLSFSWTLLPTTPRCSATASIRTA